MGVHGLWDLLSPVGRRVSVETLAGKRLAIDASIWMVQFMKAMRDDKGEMIRNAHLLGFFRRICKLLYLRTKPVFVFDGGTPALKRRTVIARRRQRENAQAKIRKTAEKLLLNQLKQVRLRELADELENQRSNVDKGKKIVTDETDVAGSASTGTKSFADGFNQEAFDEMLAASLAAEEDESFPAAESSAPLPNPDQDEDADEDEEMIIPTVEGKIDPAILAALPPSMQLDLLVQMRERLMAENRKKYQKVKKVPARFSELQIQSYLKTVAFRREINEVQKSAGGRGIGGVQTSRIASEANREFIFSSNYEGDKLDLASTGEGMKMNDQSRVPIINTSGSAVNNTPSSEKSHTVSGVEGMKTNDQNRVPIVTTSGSVDTTTPSSVKSLAVSGAPTDVPDKDSENDVETYLDERGRVRVSRVRAMGIRMTRDLQRNLDLMKEIEEERVGETMKLNNQFGYSATLGSSSGDQSSQASDKNLCGVTSETATKEENLLNAGTTIEISFEGNGQPEFGNVEDDLFTQLVAGNPVLNFSLDNSLLNKQSLDSASEPEWEEGGIDDEGVALSQEDDPNGKSLQADGLSMEQELEWEEGSLEIQEEASPLPDQQKKLVSKGALVEETEFQEAIRRSLQDLEHRISVDELGVGEKSRTTVEVVSSSMDAGSTIKEGDWENREAFSKSSSIQQNDSYGNLRDITKGDDIVAERKYAEDYDHLEVYRDRQIGGVICNEIDVMPVKESQINLSLQDINQHVDLKCSLEQEICELDTSVRQNSGCRVQLTHASASCDMAAADGVITKADGHSKWTAETEKASGKYPVKEVDITQESAEKEMHQRFLNQLEEPLDKVASSDYRKENIDVTRATLEAEMLMLDEEYKELGDKQRKLERNAESVNSEVFAECQELLQIFGLPYIIAPMEAEAQCAYMELVNLVDGVVTDDSDVLLFGARNVYKNIFDDRKYVETYFMKDIESELGLSRENLIRMAMLLGSDYTEGVSGIGIVNAIEVVNAFPEEDGLHRFREWIESPDPSILGAGLKSINTSPADGHISGSGDDVQMKRQFMDKHRNVSKNWHIPSSFPSEAVISAYNSPQVDKSTTPFSWGKPDHYVLRKLCWEKFGWNIQKADELLLPVLMEYNKRETQLRMEAFYTFNERFAKIRSKRIKKAVKGITGNTSSQLMNDGEETSTENATKGKGSTNVSNEDSMTEKFDGKKLRKRNNLGKARLSVESGNSLSTEGGIGQSQSRRANVKHKCGVGGTGNDKHSSTKRARRKGNPSPKFAPSCSDDEISDEREQHPQVSSAEPCQIRRSGRPRKEVNYAIDDVEFDNPIQDEGNPIDENAAGEEPYSEALKAGNSVDEPSSIQATEHLNPEYSGQCTSFPLDEAKQDTVLDQLSTCPTTEDYLAMGGGFCLDEDGKDGDVQGLSSCSTRGEVFDSDLPNSSILGEDENTAVPTRGRISFEEVERASFANEIISSPSEQSMNEDDTRKGLLSAMPNLKRKRRKN